MNVCTDSLHFLFFFFFLFSRGMFLSYYYFSRHHAIIYARRLHRQHIQLLERCHIEKREHYDIIVYLH